MDRDKLSTFIQAAEGDLAAVRSSLLVVAQGGDAAGLEDSRRVLQRLGKGALECGQPAVAAQISDCDNSIDRIVGIPLPAAADVNRSLDLLASLEATLLVLPIDNTFVPDVDDFVDESFGNIAPNGHEPLPTGFTEDFDIDEETLEIFRGEAEELLASIDSRLEKLSENAADQSSLWEIRRNAHTLKGAAGIVGLRAAAEIAHRTEDLLDRLVELRREPQPAVIAFIQAASRSLASVVAGYPADDLEDSYRAAAACLDGEGPQSQAVDAGAHRAALGANTIESIKPPPGPIVRVSLDRLDELIKISRGLLINHSALAERFADLRVTGQDGVDHVEALVDAQRRLTDELHAKLLHVRMVKFGNLETRLARTVHVTCLDECKLAAVEIENGDTEIDTQIIDALIEPLLHLLKNAVVHGIESPELRRLIGKPEKGMIRVRVESDDNLLVLTVRDDGGGIALARIKEKAEAAGMSHAELAAMPDRDLYRLVFERGLTTAEKIDMNAGRGVGMSIVKEAIEACGGSVHVTSEPQRGTEFSIVLPLKTEPAASSADQFFLSERPASAGGQFRTQAEAGSNSTGRIPLVLIVDDSASIRRITAKHVEEAGFRAITADSGADALELLLNNTCEPDLILSDVEMPQINGWDFLEYLKTDDNLGHIPVVMVTSLDTDEHRTRAFELGASDYLVKPFSSDDVHRVLGIIAPAAVA